MLPHLSGPRRTVQQQMRQIVIVDEPRQNRNNVLVRNQILERCRTVFFHPWHLNDIAADLWTPVLDYVRAGVGGGGCGGVDVHVVFCHGDVGGGRRWLEGGKINGVRQDNIIPMSNDI